MTSTGFPTFATLFSQVATATSSHQLINRSVAVHMTLSRARLHVVVKLLDDAESGRE